MRNINRRYPEHMHDNMPGDVGHHFGFCGRDVDSLTNYRSGMDIWD